MDFDDTVLNICKNYKGWTLNGTFGEVLAFLEGYSKGANIGYSGSVFSQFAEWLKKRFHYPHTHFWVVFRENHPDDATTIATFARLWQEYRSTPNSSPKEH